MNIQVGLNKDIEKAREVIYSYFPEKKVNIEEIDYKTRYVFNIKPLKIRGLKDFYNRITDMILELILNIYTDDIIVKQINSRHKNLKKDEKREIKQISKKILLNKDNFLIEKQYINNRIKSYILEKPYISIDGFIAFRLKDFNIFINLVIDKGIEEFTAKKEYKEFISVLKYFVEVQEPKYNVINLVFDDEDYILMDKEGNRIDINFFEEIIIEIEKERISQEDLLISALIVLAPENIIIHLDKKNKEKDVIKIIADVFENRVYYCLGCEICNNIAFKKTLKN